MDRRKRELLGAAPDTPLGKVWKEDALGHTQPAFLPPPLCLTSSTRQIISCQQIPVSLATNRGFVSLVFLPQGWGEGESGGLAFTARHEPDKSLVI